jgi:hypothetical protein
MLAIISVISDMTMVTPAMVSIAPTIAVVPVIIIVVIVSFPVMFVVTLVSISKKSRTC